MRQQATVRQVISPSHALVSVRRRGSCSTGCENCGGCKNPDEQITVTAFSDIEIHQGDSVTLESSSAQVLGLAALLYAMPLVLMIGAYFLPLASESLRIAASALGLAVGLGACVIVSRRMKRKGKVTFKIIEVLSSPPVNHL